MSSRFTVWRCVWGILMFIFIIIISLNSTNRNNDCHQLNYNIIILRHVKSAILWNIKKMDCIKNPVSYEDTFAFSK